ncbi:AMP-binding protein [Marinobacter iranensis]|nr:AMP-binding protein [Marinobacter iranensis]
MLRKQAETFGDKIFLSFEGQDFSFSELDHRTNRVANAFRKQLGISKGDHVALLMGNCTQFVLSIFALAKLGAVAVPINTAAKGVLLEYLLHQSTSKAIIVQHELYERAASIVDGLKGFGPVVIAEVDGGSVPEGTVNFDDMLDADGSCPEVFVDPRDTMFLMFTSGTTGPSKGVVSPHSQGLSCGNQAIEAYGYTPDDVIFTCLPLFHANALWYSFMSALVCGAKLVVTRRFSGSNYWEEIVSSGATQTNALGAMANIALKELGRIDRSRLKLRQMMVVPALDGETARPLTDLGIKMTSLFAQTETFAVTLHGPDEPLEKAGSAGRPRAHVSLAILDDDDNALAPGEVGEIALRPMAPGIMMDGYFRMPEETLSSCSTLWFHTGDRGYLDKDDYLYFVDRKKDAIRRRGENISTYELEMIICSYDSIREAAAVAVPSELGEDDVLVFVVMEEGHVFEAEKIIRFCDENMPYFMVPRYLEAISALPKTTSEKVEKYKLREIAADRMKQLWDREASGIKLKR